MYRYPAVSEVTLTLVDVTFIVNISSFSLLYVIW